MESARPGPPEVTLPGAGDEPGAGEATLPDPPAAADFDRLAADLPDLLASYGARSAVWFMDLSSGREMVLGGDQRFHPASTLKPPLVVALIEGAQAGRWSLDDSWPLAEADWEDCAGNLQAVPAGTAFSLRELARRARPGRLYVSDAGRRRPDPGRLRPGGGRLYRGGGRALSHFSRVAKNQRPSAASTAARCPSGERAAASSAVGWSCSAACP